MLDAKKEDGSAAYHREEKGREEDDDDRPEHKIRFEIAFKTPSMVNAKV